MEISVLTYNINKFRNWRFQQNEKNYLKELIKKVDADIVLLQEFAGENSKNSQIAQSLEDFCDDIWPHFIYGKNSVYSYGHHGNAILSKYPITHWKNFDLTTNRFEQRGILYAQVEIVSEEKVTSLDLYCTHLDLLQMGRNKQTDQVVKIIKENSAENAYILAGDLNDWNLKIHKKLKSCLEVEEASEIVNSKLLKTFPSISPRVCLDRIYIKNLIPTMSDIPFEPKEVLFSDHLPINMRFKING